MKNIESESNKREIMPCEYKQGSFDELTQEGWKVLGSFHPESDNDWNNACKLIREWQAKGNNEYEIALVKGTPEGENVTYIIRKKIISVEGEQKGGN